MGFQEKPVEIGFLILAKLEAKISSRNLGFVQSHTYQLQH